VIYIHATEAYAQLLISIQELKEIDDERTVEMEKEVKALADAISKLMENAILTIPGIMTPAELEEELEHAEQHSTVNWALRPTATSEDDDDEWDDFPEWEDGWDEDDESSTDF
jgi:hypothetical protein